MGSRVLAKEQVPLLARLGQAHAVVDPTGVLHDLGRPLPRQLDQLSRQGPEWHMAGLIEEGLAFLAAPGPDPLTAYVHAGRARPATLRALGDWLAGALDQGPPFGAARVRLTFYFQGWDDVDFYRAGELQDFVRLLIDRRDRAVAAPRSAVAEAEADAYAAKLLTLLERHAWRMDDHLASELSRQRVFEQMNVVAADERLLYFGEEIARFLGDRWESNLNRRLSAAAARPGFARAMAPAYRAARDGGRPLCQDVATALSAGPAALAYRYRRLVAPVYLPQTGMEAPGTVSVLYKPVSQIIRAVDES